MIENDGYLFGVSLRTQVLVSNIADSVRTELTHPTCTKFVVPVVPVCINK